jgi:hypothetical protein
MQLLKKSILAAALFLTVGTASSFAAPTDELNNTVKTAFQKDFRKAELISSESGKDYTRLTLKMNGTILFAYYSENGELLAIVHNITVNQLPLHLLLKVKNDYSKFWISDLFEYNSNGSSVYYITLENADYKITLRSSDGEWDTSNKSVKP